MREDRVINVFYHDRLVGTLAMTNKRYDSRNGTCKKYYFTDCVV